MAAPLLAGVAKFAAGAGKVAKGAAIKGKAGAKLAKNMFAKKKKKDKQTTSKEGGSVIWNIKQVVVSVINLNALKSLKNNIKAAAKGKKDGPINRAMDGIDKVLFNIIDTLGKRNKLAKKRQKDSRIQADLNKKKKRQGILEGMMKGGKKILGNIASGVKGWWEKLQKFLLMTLIGSLIASIIANWEAIKEKIGEVVKTIKGIWEKLEPVLTPLWKALKWITVEGFKLIGKVINHFKNKKQIEEGTKKLEKDLDEMNNKTSKITGLFEKAENEIKDLKNQNPDDLKKAVEDQSSGVEDQSSEKETQSQPKGSQVLKKAAAIGTSAALLGTPAVAGVQPQTPLVSDITVGERAGYSESRGRVHSGRDIAAPSGMGLTVPSESVITDKGTQKDYGNYVVFKDAQGMEHMYAHLKAPCSYEVGDTVVPGDVIGRVGSTGRSTGPHLHWEISDKIGKVGYPRENVLDPIEYGYSPQSPFIMAPSRKKDVSSLNEQTSYEASSPQVVFIPLPSPSQQQSGGEGGGGSTVVPVGGSENEFLNRYYSSVHKARLYKGG